MRLQSLIASILLAAMTITSWSCGGEAKVNAADEAPPPAKVESEAGFSLVTVDRRDGDKFQSVVAGLYESAQYLTANGSVFPDVSLQVPAYSLASGRAVEVPVRLGDSVRKGQLLLKVQSSDVSAAYQDYLKAVADEKLSLSQLTRARELKDKGAIAQKDLEVAENAEDDAKVTVRTAREHLKEFGADPDRPSDVVEVHAPISGVITEQNVTAGAGVKTPDNSPNLFTISNLSTVWIICDVYENDLSFVKIGEYADVHLAADPKQTLRGRIDNIGPILDPSIRTAKVRLQVSNPGILRIGMFITATFQSLNKQTHSSVPATSILHLHDREWAYTPAGDLKFRRVEVISGKMLPDGMQEVISGIAPGDKVVRNALILQNTVEQ